MEQGPDGSTQIFVQPLLGCYSRAPTRTAALQKIPSKIQEYNAWLEWHGEDTEGSSRTSFRLQEEVKADWPVDLGDSVALFECDRVALPGKRSRSTLGGWIIRGLTPKTSFDVFQGKRSTGSLTSRPEGAYVE
ncbi:MAG TPA: hypothetical protein VNA15_05935 [Candidatus Angelobacter sp.]|nr:hypothetical protein [Candidatus Angelobacter sp.]